MVTAPVFVVTDEIDNEQIEVSFPAGPGGDSVSDTTGDSTVSDTTDTTRSQAAPQTFSPSGTTDILQASPPAPLNGPGTSQTRTQEDLLSIPEM